jgi:hypothetical protein
MDLVSSGAIPAQGPFSVSVSQAHLIQPEGFTLFFEQVFHAGLDDAMAFYPVRTVIKLVECISAMRATNFVTSAAILRLPCAIPARN